MAFNRILNPKQIPKSPFPKPQKPKKPQLNSQQNATTRLIQISNEYDLTEHSITHNYDELTKQKPVNSSPQKDTKSFENSTSRKKLNLDIHYKTQRSWCKNNNCISGQQVCVMKKDKIVNLSSFLILQNDNLSNFSISASKKKIEQIESDSQSPKLRLKSSKNLINFIRKRNIHINVKQDQIYSSRQHQKNILKMPEIHINMSCQLKRSKGSPIKLMINNQEEPFHRSPSPTFKNKLKMSNYIKFKMSKYK